MNLLDSLHRLTTEDLKRYIKVLYKENKELKEIIDNKFKADLLKG